MSLQYSIIEFRSTEKRMQGIMHAARVAPHGLASGYISLTHPAAGMRARPHISVLSSTIVIEPDEPPLRKRRPASPPELCVGRRTTDERSQETAWICSADTGKKVSDLGRSPRRARSGAPACRRARADPVTNICLIRRRDRELLQHLCQLI